MMDRRPFARIGKIDRIGLALMAVLVALGILAAFAALRFGWFRSPWELIVWFGVSTAFIAVGLGASSQPLSRNTGVYGAAKPASESEAKAAARGDKQSASLHDQSFPD